MMLPSAFLERMQQQLGEDFYAFLQSYDRPKSPGLRMNPLKTNEPPALPFALEPIPWAENGYYYDPNVRPGLHPYHEAGLYYLQEPSAMAPAELLNPQPGDRVLDLCAAPGGKSTQLAAKMAGQGLLICNEYNSKRAKILAQNVERMGISNALVLNETPTHLAQKFPGFFDKILVDAPCSGEGMFRKEPAALEDWNPELVELCARRQAGILDDAAKMLAPGGILVYSTCTFSPQENELCMAAFLERNPDFSLIPTEHPCFAKGAEPLPGTLRLWPHLLRGEGHFAAKLQKNGEEAQEPDFQKPEKLPKAFLEFQKELGITLPEGQALSFGENWFWTPVDFPLLKGLKVLRPGLELGSCRNDRFLPAHALALWLKTAKNLRPLSSLEEANTYLAGETLPSEASGWTLVTLDGLSLGWGKSVQGTLKNHYPKGLRRRNG